ncbi:MAG: VOC family protein [Anaerolineales bacterium]|jgi:lactoylglutathione lyase
MIERIDHTALVVSDMAQSIDFYTGILGFRIVKELDFPGRKLVMISIGYDLASKIELIRYDETDLSDPVPVERTPLGLRHLALHVDDVAATYQDLIEAGVEMEPEPPFQRPDGPPIAFGRDPDGVLLEFSEL